ncbi:3-oxoadipate enol-lactonase [Cupriavidus sp. AU9028]|uniref:3-oxoadipate enol-lactonase n=1 Tax=Cupriavidus sp. AU9028 TaxID=2871157 RepID=UPI001C9713D2|nr:3-oxoadipate enol-lactonase [Cupriavidus sp. AU9028]MBY4899233.1 3-oxoadipate enol-lactonase [Cupriavidus sp. AU9028]
MPYATIDGLSLHYTLEGDPQAPVLVLSNSLGTSLGMWDPQMPALLRRYRVLRYDTRGHGHSGIAQAPFGIDTLGRDVLAVLEHAGIATPAHFCGLSMGGMTGIWLAAHHPGRFRSFVLANTAAMIGPASVWDNRIATVRRDGMAAIVDAVLQRWFTQRTLDHQGDGLVAVRAMLQRTDPHGYAGNCAAIRDADLRASLQGIRAPVLVIAGKHDAATTPAQGRALAEGIKGAHYVELDAAHLSNWERPAEFTAALLDFIERH